VLEGLDVQLAVVADSEYTAVVIDSSTVLNPIALTDSGGIPAAGKTKLQVANFASLAGPIDVYRRQPDFDGLVDLMFPFDYRAVSGYVQSDPGDWQVLVATLMHERFRKMVEALHPSYEKLLAMARGSSRDARNFGRRALSPAARSAATTAGTCRSPTAPAGT
jgi:hypothetical protein